MLSIAKIRELGSVALNLGKCFGYDVPETYSSRAIR
jgi:hypothetical protein